MVYTEDKVQIQNQNTASAVSVFAGRIFGSKHCAQRAFTIFEMLVSIAVFTVLTSVVLVKNNQFKGTTALNNLAYEIALVIRQAQVYGLSVAKDTVSSSDTAFQHSYGIRFPVGADTTEATHFMLFVDRNDNMTYDAGSGALNPGDDVELFTLRPGTKIHKVCVDLGVYASERCATMPSSQYYVEALFTRPSPDALIKGQFSGATIDRASTMSVIIKSSSGLCREIYATSAGQIAVRENIDSSLCQ